MNEIEFELSKWGATIYYSERGTDGVWNGVFNLKEVEDHKANKKQATALAVTLFQEEGLDLITIYAIEAYKLEPLEGGENG